MSSFSVSKEGIEQAKKILTDIMCEAAKFSLPLKRIRKFKTHKPKKWFNKECKRARTLYKQAANKVNNNPSEQQFLEEKIIRLKRFKKICKTKQKDFWNRRSKELGENNNSKFWDIWKKSNENITIKSHDSVDVEKWENFYSNLFKNYNVENSMLEQENSQVPKNCKKFQITIFSTILIN